MVPVEGALAPVVTPEEDYFPVYHHHLSVKRRFGRVKRNVYAVGFQVIVGGPVDVRGVLEKDMNADSPLFGLRQGSYEVVCPVEAVRGSYFMENIIM